VAASRGAYSLMTSLGWPTVYHYFRQWRFDGTWEQINGAIRERLRVQGCVTSGLDLQADFGYLPVIILPLQSLLVFLSMALIVRATIRYSTSLWLVSGLFLYYLIQAKAGYTALLTLYRNVILVAAVYLFAHVILKSLSPLRTHRNGSWPYRGPSPR
jgi:hypothetical protein